jgi:hypothetical protein
MGYQETPNPPVNADARDVPASASYRAARAGYRERYAARDDVVRREISARSGPLCVFPNAVVRVRATTYSGGTYTVPHA